MSQELERVYTINLGKVLLTPDNQRAKRAINMIKEFARRHMKNERVKIEEELSHQIWKRGIRHPPRKIRVRMTKTDEGFVLVSPYEEEIEEATKPKEEKETPSVEEKQAEIETAPEVPKPEEAKELTEEKAEPSKDTKTKELKEKAKPATKPKAKESKEKPKSSKPKETKTKTPKEEKTKKSKKTESKKAKPKPKESKKSEAKKAKPKKKSK